MISAQHAVLRTGRHRSPEHLAAAVNRHDAVTAPDRLHVADQRARQLSPDHHRALDEINLRSLRAHLDAHPDVMSALAELDHHQQAQAAQAARDARRAREAARAQAAANLAQIDALGRQHRHIQPWYGLGSLYINPLG